MGIAVLYGAWRPFGQIAILDVQFTAAAAVAEFLVEESSGCVPTKATRRRSTARR
jgi:hypothetical protein